MALLILPVATATLLSRKIPVIMALAAALCFLCSFLGVGLSYSAGRGSFLQSPGAVIVELSGAAYLGVWLCAALMKKILRGK